MLTFVFPPNRIGNGTFYVIGLIKITTPFVVIISKENDDIFQLKTI